MILSLDKNGFIINEGNKQKIQPEFKKIIIDINRKLPGSSKKDAISFYVRGSVSVGRAISNISDIDCVLIINREPSEQEKKKIKNLSTYIEKKYPDITGLDLTVVFIDKLLYSDKYKNLRTCLKTQSALIFGEDIVSYLGGVRPSREFALYMYADIKKDLNELINIFKTGKPKKYLGRKRSIGFWCVWTCRVILRSSLGLTMERERIYTPDLLICKEVFKKNFPSLAKEINMIADWSTNPTNDKKVFYNFLVDFLPKYDKMWTNLKSGIKYGTKTK